MAETPPNPYNIGTRYPVMPVAPAPEHCIAVDAGAVRFVVEARDLIDEMKRGLPPGSTIEEKDVQFNDFGASLHVYGTQDGLEHLRFDCFEDQPHYHYIDPDEEANVIVRLDDIAEDDPIDWTTSRLRTRLPEMLDFAGAHGIAAAVRDDLPAVLAAVDQVHDLLQEAQRRALDRRATGAALAP
jgi:hypothetical protein